MSQLNLGDSLILDSDYLTSEVKTGETWIDGKPIYRKVYQGTTPATDNTYTAYSISMPDVAEIINFWGQIYTSSGTTKWPLPCFRATTDYASVIMYVGGIGLTVASVSNILESRPFYVVYYYTKTTD